MNNTFETVAIKQAPVEFLTLRLYLALDKRSGGEVVVMLSPCGTVIYFDKQIISYSKQDYFRDSHKLIRQLVEGESLTLRV